MTKRVMWLSRQRDGNYMFSYLQPTYDRILGTRDDFDFYLTPGEPIGLRHWCANGVKAFFGVELAVGESIRVWVTAGVEQ